VSTCSPPSVPRRLAAALALVVVAVTVLAGCGSDESPSSEAEPSAVTATAPSTTTTVAPTTAPPTTTTTLPPPPPPQIAGSPLGAGPNGVYVLGDSVTLGAQTTMPAALAGWNVTFDAAESRRVDQGTAIVRGMGGAMGRVLVVHLCTNWGGGDYRGAASRLLDSLNGVERVVWVTCTPWLPAVGQADADIWSLPASYPNVVVADWGAISATPGYTYNDGLHLKPDGAAALAALIAGAIGPAPA